MKRWALVCVGLLLLTVVVDGLLWQLGLHRVDWTVFTGDPSDPRHSRPVFSPIGFTIWTAVVAVYAGMIILLARRLVARQRGCLGGVAASGLLLLGWTVLIALVHPTFVLTVTSGALRSFVLSAASKVPPLLDIYQTWGGGLVRQIWWIVLAQLVMGILLALLVGKSDARHGSARVEHSQGP